MRRNVTLTQPEGSSWPLQITYQTMRWFEWRFGWRLTMLRVLEVVDLVSFLRAVI